MDTGMPSCAVMVHKNFIKEIGKQTWALITN